MKKRKTIPVSKATRQEGEKDRERFTEHVNKYKRKSTFLVYEKTSHGTFCLPNLDKTKNHVLKYCKPAQSNII